jgi:hypothetical protein
MDQEIRGNQGSNDSFFKDYSEFTEDCGTNLDNLLERYSGLTQVAATHRLERIPTMMDLRRLRYRVLIVDDSSYNLFVMKELL